MCTSLPTVSETVSVSSTYRNTTNELTGDSIDMIGAVSLEHVLDGGPLPGIGGPIAFINVDGKGDLHVDLGLLDSLEDET